MSAADDTHPNITPDQDLADQIHGLIAWIDRRLGDESANRQLALERALDYLDWLAYRADQIGQQHGIPLVPPDAERLIVSPNRRCLVPLPKWPGR